MEQRRIRQCVTVRLLLLLLLLSLAVLGAVNASITTLTTRDKPPLYAHVQMTPTATGRSQGLAFKILQLADLHFTGDASLLCREEPYDLAPAQLPCNESLMSAFVDELLDLEKPDLVVFTGDNVQTFAEQDRQRAVDAFTRGVEQRQIPFAVVLGNHDDENGFAREDVLRMAMNKRMSYAQRGPLSVDGVGNYQLSVRAPVGGAWGNASDAVLQLYFLDSGGYVNRTLHPDVDSKYDWIKPSQVAYYRNLSIAARASQPVSAASRSPLPALMFFHIPLQEYNQSAANWTRISGEVNERVETSDVHSELFAALVERDEVKAAFCGHDHINEFCYNVRGIQLCYGGGAGFGAAYGSSKFARRARVIEWSVSESGTRSIRSWKRLFGDTLRKYTQEVLFTQVDVASAGLTAAAGGSKPNSTVASSSGMRLGRTLQLGLPVLLVTTVLVILGPML